MCSVEQLRARSLASFTLLRGEVSAVLSLLDVRMITGLAGSPSMVIMTARPVVFPPVADPLVNVRIWVFTSPIDC